MTDTTYADVSCSKDVDVFVSNSTILDPEIFQLWVDGRSYNEAVSTLHQQSIANQTNTPVEFIASDVMDQYRTFDILKKSLSEPKKLSEQLMFQLDEPTKKMLIEKYANR